MTGEPKRKLFWTVSEARTVALQFLVEKATGAKSDLAAARAAQMKLPPERRKNITTWAHVKTPIQAHMEWATAKFEEARVLSQIAQGEHVTRDAEAAPVECPPSSDTQPEPESVKPSVSAHGAGTIEDAIVAALKRIVIRVINDPDIRAQIIGALSPAPQAQTKPEPEKREVIKVPVVATLPSKLPKIAVVGAIGPQCTELAAEFKDRAILRFWTTDQKVQDLKALCQWCDACVVFIRFIGHDAFDKVKAAAAAKFGGFPLLANNNGVSTAKSLIERELDRRAEIEGAARRLADQAVTPIKAAA